MPSRPKVPKDIQTEVFLRTRRRCCVCFGLHRDTAVKRGQIAHLDGKPTNNDIENLSFLCLEHHDEFDSRTSQSKGLTVDELKAYRDELSRTLDPRSAQRSASAEAPLKHTGFEDRSPSWPAGQEPVFPDAVVSFVAEHFPGFGLPASVEISGDWAMYGDPESLFPLYCAGDFFGDGELAHAFFVVAKKEKNFRIVVVRAIATTRATSTLLFEGPDYPQNMYLLRVEPGRHRTIHDKEYGFPVSDPENNPRFLISEHDSLCVGIFESASWLYYWDSSASRFEEVGLSD